MVSVGGLASGIDSRSLIDQLMQVDSRSVRLLEQKIAGSQKLQAAFTGLGPRLADLKAAASGLDRAALDAPSVVGGETDAFSVTAGGAALPATHELRVHQLATASRLGSQGVADARQTPIASGPGTFTVQAGRSGAQVTVAVTASTTLNDLARAINAVGGDIGASVVNDGTASNANRLVLTSKKTGLANAVTVTRNDTSLDFGSPRIESPARDAANGVGYTGTVTSSGSFTGSSNRTYTVEIVSGGAPGVATYRFSTDGGVTWRDNGGAGFATSEAAAALGDSGEGVQLAFGAGGALAAGDRFSVDVTVPTLQAAQDAVFTLDGIRQSRATNEVRDAVEGVTFNLKAVDETARRVSITRSSSVIVDKVEKLVKAYNDVYKAVADQQRYDAEEKKGGMLLGDATANALLGRLRSAVTSAAGGVSGGVRSLLDLGVKSGQDGLLVLDKARLERAISERRDAVLSVLSSAEVTTSSALEVVKRPEGAADGTYAVNVTRAAARAGVAAGAAMTDTLAQDENLVFTFSSDYTGETPSYANFTVTLRSGDSLARVVERLNSSFVTEEVGLRAFADGGALRLESTAPGADQRLTVRSDRAAGPGTTRLGDVTLTGQGVDIAGTIDGRAATGLGDRLTAAAGTPLAGLSVSYSGAALGAIGDVSLSTGISSSFEALVAGLNEGEKSLIGSRNKAIGDQIKSIERSIERKNEQLERLRTRLERQFTAMEVSLSGIKSQADFMLNQLAQLG